MCGTICENIFVIPMHTVDEMQLDMWEKEAEAARVHPSSSLCNNDVHGCITQTCDACHPIHQVRCDLSIFLSTLLGLSEDEDDGFLRI